MRITEEQLAILNTLCCERLSSKEENLRLIEDFTNYKNSNIVDVLQGDAYTEDESGSIAYYLVKNQEGAILFFFSLKCGLLYDEFIEGEKLRTLQTFYNNIMQMMNDGKTSVEEKAILGTLLEKTRTKKGLQKRDIAQIVHKSPAAVTLERLFKDDAMNVGKTFPGIELVHFCANDRNRAQWNQYGFNQKMGTVIFWHFIVPIVLKVMRHVGCEYLFLFAADMTEDEELVLYYKENMKFRDTREHGVAIPLYDFACKFMFQETKNLLDFKDAFFSSFNRDEDAV